MKLAKIYSTKLNLGCGRDVKSGYANMDVAALPGVDVVWDLNRYPWPFKDHTFNEIYASHVLEHVDDFVHCMEEIYRVLQPNGKLFVKVPIFPSIYAMNDPTHKHFFTYFTFEYFTPGHTYAYYSKAKFSILRREIVFSWNLFLRWIGWFVNLHPKFYSRYLAFIFPSNELQVDLSAVK